MSRSDRSTDITFNELPWHDAELLAISIDRQMPGDRDDVHLNVAWPNGDKAVILFSDCRRMTARMNFGVIAKESILTGSVVEGDPELLEIRQTWQKMGVTLDLLCCYQIKTNSTASIIRIYAERFEVLAE